MKHTNTLQQDAEILGEFVKLIKATISIVAVRPSVSIPTGRIFMKFDTSIFRKPAEKVQVPLKYDKNNGYFV